MAQYSVLDLDKLKKNKDNVIKELRLNKIKKELIILDEIDTFNSSNSVQPLQTESIPDIPLEASAF